MPNNPYTPSVLQEDLPLYPPLLQLLRVTDTTVPGPSGVTQPVAGSSVPGPTLYVAFTEQLRTDGLLPRDREPCLVDDMNGLGLLPGYYLGRLAGTFNSLPVYEVGAAGSANNRSDKFYVYVTETDQLPDGDGRYQAVLANENADGTLAIGTKAVWAREANNSGRLINDYFYHAHYTGFANGRDVYTIDDTDLTISNESFTEFVTQILGMYMIPDRCWTIAQHADGVRLGTVKRLFEVRETAGTVYDDIFRITFDPATNWEVTDADDDGDVTVQRVLNIREGTTSRTTLTWQVDFDSTDFDVTATASGHATINTEGYTGSFCVLTDCVAGVLKRRLLTFTRGLLKTVGAESDTCP